jgi:hypothetical protein
VPDTSRSIQYFPTIFHTPDLTEWKRLIDQLEVPIEHRIGDAREARHIATVLGDAWLNATHVAKAIEAMAEDDDFEKALRSLLWQLDEFDLELLWYYQPAARLYRKLAGHSWNLKSDEVEFLAGAMEPWYRSQKDAMPAARLLVDLRGVSRRASVDLSHRDLLASATGHTPGGKRKLLRLLERLNELSRLASEALKRKRMR